MKRTLVGALAALAGVVGTPAAVPDADAVPAFETSCAWSAEVSPRTLDQLNIALPDTGASYWLLPYIVRPNQTITLRGHFPDARYLSFNTYTSTFNGFTRDGVSSAIADYRIEPEPGDANPWRTPTAPGGSYTITLRPDVAAGQPNTLPLAPANAMAEQPGFLIMRTYLPSGGPGAVPLPEVTMTIDGVARSLPTCQQPARTPALDAAMRAITAAGLPLPGADSAGFARVDTSGPVSAFPNVDNAYLRYALVPPRDNRVLVVRGKAPRTTRGEHPAPWPSSVAEVRYFSMCAYPSILPGPVARNPLPDGTIDEGCRTDDQTAVDADGYYTYVVGTEGQRERIEQIPGATFVPFDAAHADRQQWLLLRNMLPDGDFPHAVQNVPAGTPPAQAAEIMGPYYPRTALCELSESAAGTSSCPPR
ncbi:hypothetical protein [Nocardia abscessus]|uniref:hypothetical protein n=1 Tax=Nocardia abscessus TaxID=120957 RepID=UPI002456E019|nr:hypothetical protein [Nocardia abscessus]